MTTAVSQRPPRRAGAAQVRRIAVVVVVLVVLAVELVLGGPSLAAALRQLRTPHWGWLAGAVLAEIISMGGYARMQRRLLRSAGTPVALGRHVALAYAAHSLSVTLPGGPLFSTRFNFRQMRRYGATPAVASWCIALSGILSSTALVLIATVGAIVAGSSRSWWTLLAYVLAALVIAAVVQAVARHPHWLITPARAVLSSVNRVRGRPAVDGSGRVASLVQQITAVRIPPKDLAVAGYFAVMNWLLDALCLWMCCRAVDTEHIGATQLVIAYCAGMAAASVPLVPGNLGVVDGALILGLVAGGVTGGGAIAAVVLYRLVSFGFIIAAGWVVWLIMRSREQRRAAQPDVGMTPGREAGQAARLPD